jgi:1-acylglycerone phosphate reductase
MEGLSAGIEKVTLDTLNNNSVNEAVKTIIDREGRIDILVNNAGGNRVGKLPGHCTPYLRV